MRIAFKEWAVVIDALSTGQQIIILRKGGIREGQGGFAVEHSEFLLFPTLFHQHRDSVIPSAQERFDGIARQWPEPSVLRLEYLAEVVAWQRLRSLTVAERLCGHHIWRDEVIRDRFDWGREQSIHCLAVRVRRLPAQVELSLLASYGGCKSWIELAENISTEGSRTVLNDNAFALKMDQLRVALDDLALTLAPKNSG